MEPNRKLKAAIGNNGGGNQLPPQKCPRCESMNTKFCYFNNYSLSQPRYFCKTCRRYWTQGGTLRNVPVGGSSRRGKRLKTTAAAPPQQQLNLAGNSGANFDSNKELNPNLMNSLYPAGGFLSSLAAIQNLRNTAVAQPQLPPVNQLDFGGSNLSFSDGFSGQQRQFYQNWQPFSNGINTSVANSATAAANAAASVGSFPMNPNEDQWSDLSNFGDCPP